jgi:hypothetical protein
MPIPGDHFDMFVVTVLQLAGKAENENHRKENKTHNYVAGMQTN